MTNQLQPYKFSPAKDAAAKFQVAFTTLPLTQLQRTSLQLFTKAVKRTNLSNLPIEIGLTPDDEIYISRTSGAGINNILIYEDGTTAHSFIGYEGSTNPDFLTFSVPVEPSDFENLLVDFFTCH